MGDTKLVPINIWDDYAGDCEETETHKYTQKTFGYIETDEIPLYDQKKYLFYLMGYIGEHLLSSGVVMTLDLYDSRDLYPTLPDSMHYKRWRINFVGLTHKLREHYVEELNKAELPFRVYSES